ncbi:hypothetical protein HanPSC8_Chr00c627g0809351 [Helianthus annuus]|nr:hypothetical protein HanPSC8_Chr00c627g0809351 [Helianthus annuus]
MSPSPTPIGSLPQPPSIVFPYSIDSDPPYLTDGRLYPSISTTIRLINRG